jgi:dipeptidyl aminopeptidase/acylaminoacyl peptidase
MRIRQLMNARCLAVQCLLYAILVTALAGCLTVDQPRLWTTSGARYRRPSLSPDGRWLLFESDQHVHICLLDGSGRRCLSESLETSSTARWSPDGRQIIFTGRAKGVRDLDRRDLYRTDPEGRELVNLTNTPATAEDFVEWSPDGQRIVFFRHDPATKRNELVIAAADGSGARVLTTGWGARWSPDGRWIAYSTGKLWDLRVIGADGSNDRKLGTGGPITWTPDSQAIFYTPPRSGTDQPYHVYRIRLDGGENGLVLENAWVEGDFDARFLWDPSGTRLALAVHPIVGRRDRNGLVILNVQGTILADHRRADGFEYDACVSWSADARTLFFGKFRAQAGTPWEGGIYTIRADGTGETQLLADTVQWQMQPPRR